MQILPAEFKDRETLADIFLGHISAHHEYISHGEMQMGVGEGFVLEDGLHTRPAPDARQKWLKYIQEHLDNKETASVWKAVAEDGTIIGFSVADIEEDGDAPFGMVCDVLVREHYRSHGAGAALLQAAIDWLRSRGIKDIYLESGKNNHAAHRFFEKRGFAHVSEIYYLL